MPLYVILATTSRPQLLERTLESLAHCRKPDNFAAVVVVENGPRGDAKSTVAQCGADLVTRYEYIARANKSAALNHALEAVGDSLVLFVDDDIRAHRDLLCAYASAARRIGCGQFYGGPMGVDYEEAPPEWLLEYLPASARGWSLDSELSVIDDKGVFFMGCNWCAFASDIKEAGGFDPDYGPGSPSGRRGQETDMQRRLSDFGVVKVYVPDAEVWHYVPRERCSPKWALLRRYRASLSWSSPPRYQGPTIGGVPRWMYRELSKKGFHAIGSTMNRDPQVRFDAAYQLLAHVSRMLEFRRASQQR
jgi:glycosyltransferase involved in cell wall biosynthesis